MRLRTILRWALYPLVYAAVTPALFVASLASFGFFEMRLSGTIEVTGYALGPLLVVALVFVLPGIGLVRLERLRPPTIRDHLRHCVLLYLGITVLGAFIVVTYDGRYCCGLRWSLAVLLSLVATYSIVVSASTIYVVSHRSRAHRTG